MQKARLHPCLYAVHNSVQVGAITQLAKMILVPALPSCHYSTFQSADAYRRALEDTDTAEAQAKSPVSLVSRAAPMRGSMHHCRHTQHQRGQSKRTGQASSSAFVVKPKHWIPQTCVAVAQPSRSCPCQPTTCSSRRQNCQTHKHTTGQVDNHQ